MNDDPFYIEMNDDLFTKNLDMDCLLERIEILEKKVDELMNKSAGAKSTPFCNYPSQEFMEFWEAYPRKQGMKPAFQAWCKCKTRPPVEEILKAIKRQKKTEQWNRGIIPLPATWLNQERFDDEV